MRGDLLHLVRYSLAEDEVIAALSHRDGKTNRRFAVKSKHRLRWVGISFFDGRDIGETEEFAVGKQIDALQIVNRVERSRNPDLEVLHTRLVEARGGDGVLLL